METTLAPGLYRMINGKNPLREKMALFFHQIFATGLSKVSQGQVMASQIQMFRQFGLSNMRTILIELSRDPAMIFWLDNNENHRNAPNENYGRELLELFTMGVGNYTEQDVKMAARAFTGWTFTAAQPVIRGGRSWRGVRLQRGRPRRRRQNFLGRDGAL